MLIILRTLNFIFIICFLILQEEYQYLHIFSLFSILLAVINIDLLYFRQCSNYAQQCNNQLFLYNSQFFNLQVIYKYTQTMTAGWSLTLMLSLVISTLSQVSVVWMQSLRIDTGNKILVANHLATTTTFTFSTSYHTNKTWSSTNPSVALSIRQLRIASNSSSIQFLSKITGSPTQIDFVNFVSMNSPTQIWYLEARYIAYDGGFNMFDDEFTMAFQQFTSLTQINSSPGSTRSQILDTGISAVAANRNILATFTTGFTGTINSTYFQANITQQVTGGNFKINITVHSDTVIQQISFYFIRVDLDELAIRSWIFGEHAITNGYNGIQYTFYNPSVLYQTNYISGLRSFSLVNNVQYNFTISGRTFTTFNDSLYNDVTHLNFWLRYCQSPYIFYNKVDSKCYQLCPAGTYPVMNDTICEPCDVTCTTCSAAGSCLTCSNNRVLVSGNCVCQDYYYEYLGVCVKCHYSCQQCVYSGQYFNCQQCDALMMRTLQADNTCPCDPGYRDVGVTACIEICGDGIIIGDQCDDANTDNNDGCSSTCQFQPYFTCDPPVPPTTPKSVCFFIGDITIDVVRIEKDPDANKATFYVKVQPYVFAFEKLTAQNLYTNISTAQFVSFEVKDGYLIYNISYESDFEGQTVNLGLKPSASATNMFSRFNPKNDTFVATASNGLLLNAYLKNDYTESNMYKQASFVLGFIFLAFGFLFCYGDWKQIGLEMFFSLQICFMTYVVLPYHNPYITKTLSIRSVMGWNEVLGKSLPPYHSAPVLQHMGYSVNFQYNFNIMAIFPGLALILYIVYRAFLYRNQKKRLQGDTSTEFEQTTSGKILCYFKFDLFVYWMLVSMQQVLMATVIQFTFISNGAVFIFIVLSLIGIVVSIVALFTRPKSMEVYRQKLFHKSYGGKTFLIVLVSVLVMDILILLSVLVNKNIFYATLICPLIVGIYVIARRPFRLLGNNFRLLIIQCCIIAVISLQLATLNLTYAEHKTYNIGIIVCMVIILIVTLVAWVYDIVKKIMRLTDEEKYQVSQYQSKKQEQSINEKVREAGYALVHGNPNASRLPTVYEMSNLPSNRSRMKKSIVQPLRSPKQSELVKKNSRRPEVNRSAQDSALRSKIKPRQSELQAAENARKAKQSNASKLKNKEYQELKKREDTEQKTDRPSTRRIKPNPYTQILNETAHHYK